MQRLIFAVFLSSIGVPVQAAPVEKHAFSYCPMTHAMGHGSDVSLPVAEDKAKNDCVMKGGLPGCCFKFFGEDFAQERGRVMHAADKFVAPKKTD